MTTATDPSIAPPPVMPSDQIMQHIDSVYQGLPDPVRAAIDHAHTLTGGGPSTGLSKIAKPSPVQVAQNTAPPPVPMMGVAEPAGPQSSQAPASVSGPPSAAAPAGTPATAPAPIQGHSARPQFVMPEPPDMRMHIQTINGGDPLFGGRVDMVPDSAADVPPASGGMADRLPLPLQSNVGGSGIDELSSQFAPGMVGVKESDLAKTPATGSGMVQMPPPAQPPTSENGENANRQSPNTAPPPVDMHSHAKELERLHESGAGWHGIHNPVLKALAGTGDVIASGLFPQFGQFIPGTTAHNMQLQQGERGALREEQAGAKSAADVAHTGAQTAESTARAKLDSERASDLSTNRESPDDARARRAASVGEYPELTPREKLEFIESGKLPSAAPVGAKKTEHWELPDGSSVYVDHDSKTGTRYLGNEEWSIPEGAKLAASSTARPTILASDYVNLDDAKGLIDKGFPVVGENGKPMNLADVPKGMVLQKIHFADGRTVYQPRNIKDTTVKLGNIVYAVEPDKVQQIPQGAGTAIGQANAGTVRMPPTIDTVNGQPVTVPGVSTPNSPGAFRRPGTASSPPATGGTEHPALNPPGGNRPAPAAHAGIPVGLYGKNSDIAKSMGSLAAQIFGSDTDPGIHGMQDFAHLADDPNSVKRIGTALTMLNSYKPELSVLGNTALNGYIMNGGVGAGPVKVGGAKTSGSTNSQHDITPEKAAEINGQLQRAMSALTPEERSYLVGLRTAKESIIGLRKLTGGSSTDSSMQALQTIVPQIGSGSGFVSSRADYDDAVRRMAAEVTRALGRVPNNMVEPGLTQRLDRIRGNSAGSAPPPPTGGGVGNSTQLDTSDPAKAAAQYNALPVGAHFTTPDGKPGVKK